MSRNDLRRCNCEGWWEQDGFGRQPMENLQIAFEKRRIDGSGTDIIGPFVLSGIVADDGAVVIRKQYIQRHGVDYLGTYDGEGVMAGEWRIGGLRGRWMIAIRRLQADPAAEIFEYVPSH